MSDLSPGQEVTVSGMSGGTAYVVMVDALIRAIGGQS
jgi:hypothetical protein